ncbi:ABC transporter substrate-binding protein [Yersinia kristensenii]|uniref:ABC transporter substrate-binding protein n=1 Tax=Yersinia kristensenii TaxID=28152 RepID=UPI001C60E871|nr:ABC transporter substrate-binding protein [Yersinia kristensenii]MBW5811699.1 ABC transporter substrate-binding protein [Yersinia kristensenii]MBW5828961.1 ABC transporter substrate-binding protein [Yersinia kristensenii]MDA5491151.1 ABC transporter substrate-binding protein [Yersinia kristensenii]
MNKLIKQCLKPILLTGLLLSSLAAHAVTVTDLAGRQVEVPDNIKRILLGEGRMIYSVAILEKTAPFTRIVGWQGDFRGLDVQGYQAFHAHFPQMDDIPLVGGNSAETFSAEKALALKPDLVILPLTGGHGPGLDSDAAKLLESAGIAVIFVDFSQHPLTHTVPSMRLLGEALGRQAEASAFITFYQQQQQRVIDRIAQAKLQYRPSIFVDYLPGLQECCGSPGHGSMGDIINAVGGRNIGEAVIPGAIGNLNPEYILAQQPDVYVATGVFPEGKPGVTLGYQATAEQAQKSLRLIAQRKPIGQLSAVKNGNVHGLWHIFYDSPENLIAIQSLAKWLHPALFSDLDPEQTRHEMYQRFMPIPATGVFSISLEQKQ